MMNVKCKLPTVSCKPHVATIWDKLDILVQLPLTCLILGQIKSLICKWMWKSPNLGQPLICTLPHHDFFTLQKWLKSFSHDINLPSPQKTALEDWLTAWLCIVSQPPASIWSFLALPDRELCSTTSRSRRDTNVRNLTAPLAIHLLDKISEDASPLKYAPHYLVCWLDSGLCRPATNLSKPGEATHLGRVRNQRGIASHNTTVVSLQLSSLSLTQMPLVEGLGLRAHQPALWA